MTDYKHHLIGGLAVTVLAAAFIFMDRILPFNLQNVCGIIFISLFFSLLPDLDIGTSMIRKIVSCAIGVAMIYAFVLNLSYFGIALAVILIVIQFFHHRGVMHSFITGLIFSALLYLYFHNWAFPFIAGINFGCHLALDS